MKTINPSDFNFGIFPVWRGFRHNWQYNHRTNRIGSFINLENNYFYSSHSGASGTGIDKLYFQDHYSLIKADQTNYYIDKIRFNNIREKEGKIASFSQKIKVKLNNSDSNLQFGALLNGFDLKCNTKSDKLRLLKIDISEISKTSKYITYEISGQLSLDCKSPECKVGEHGFDYLLDVYFLVVKSPNSNFVYERSSGSFTNQYSWKIKNKHELNLYESGQKNETLFLENTLSEFNYYAIGYRRISINIQNIGHGVDSTVHMLDLNVNIKNFRPLSNNQVLINNELFFRNWKKNMKKINFYSAWAFRQKGMFIGESKLAVLRFKNAEVNTSGFNDGEIDWKGMNANPDADSLKKTIIIKKDAEKIIA